MTGMRASARSLCPPTTHWPWPPASQLPHSPTIACGWCVGLSTTASAMPRSRRCMLSWASGWSASSSPHCPPLAGTTTVVSFFSLKSDSAPPWMVLAVLWCSMAQTLLLPSFIWSCERYRADVRTVWEQCVAIMSEEDGEDDGGCDDYADGRVCKVRFDANGATGPGDPTQVKLLPGRHMLFPPLERVHYLQVPLSRRLSHDETNIFSTPRAPGSFLHKWSSSDDIRILPAHSQALGGPPAYLGHRQRLGDEEEEEEEEEAEGGGLASLRQFLEGGILGSGGGHPQGPGFFREEITTFIDETPLPSPTASPPWPRPLGLSPRRLSLGSPDNRAIGLPLGLSAGRRCSLTGGEESARAWGGSWGPGNPIFPQLTL
uniref:G protein-coupled receptor 162 n=1 Tax=Myotis myotis TaxID=51298 RepID=A0A7J7Z2U5_MYOMY|nr:G protein-coupled receptor 162 [Myotis myotis]